jgi:hypothetical protein
MRNDYVIERDCVVVSEQNLTEQLRKRAEAVATALNLSLKPAKGGVGHRWADIGIERLSRERTCFNTDRPFTVQIAEDQ